MNPPSTSDIEVRKLFRRIGERQILRDIQFEVRSGEFFSLLGPSGCGKTTLLRCLAGLDQPSSGTIHLGGVDVTLTPPHRRNVNMVFQNYALFPHLCVADNIAFGLRIAQASHIERRVSEVLEKVRLVGYGTRTIASLSGGEQQRVALARAIVMAPRALLLDEPLGALDLVLRRGLQAELKRLQRELNMTFVYVTHDQDEALSMSDRLAVMNHGRIEQIGTPSEIYRRPRTEFVAGFVGTANIMHRGGRKFVVRPEHVRLDGSGGRTGVVTNLVFLGGRTLVTVEVAGESWVAEVTAGQSVDALKIGQAAAMSIDEHDVHLLEIDTP